MMKVKKIKHPKKVYCYEYTQERLRDYGKKHYTKNKKKIQKNNSQLLTCPKCYSKVSKINMSRHKRTKKCLNFCVDRHCDDRAVVH